MQSTITNRIEFHNPEGKSYVARAFGKETIFGKEVHRGISARVLEYANDLLFRAYETTDGPDVDGDGNPDWYVPVISSETGRAVVKWDPSLASITEGGGVSEEGRPGCNAQDSTDCVCEANRACIKLRDYTQVPYFLRLATSTYFGLSTRPRGIY